MEAIEAQQSEALAMEVEPAEKMRIRDWKGLIHDEPRRTRYLVFALLFVLASSMTFTQLGFLGIGFNGDYLCYVMGLLVPIAATALLLGKGAGSLQGLLSGAVLYAHAHVQPLDLIERYFVNILNSVVLWTYTGFFVGLVFAMALHKGPAGWRKWFNLATACAAAAFGVTMHFIINVILGAIIDMVVLSMRTGREVDELREWSAATRALGSMELSIVLNFILLLATTIMVYRIVHAHHENKGCVSVRVSFGTRLFAVVSIVFCVLSALVYALVTVRAAASASRDMEEDMTFILQEIAEGDKALSSALQSKELEDVSSETVDSIVSASYTQTFINGYKLQSYGTVVVFVGDEVAFSNSPAFPKSATMTDIYGEEQADFVTDLAASGGLRETLYDTRPLEAADDGGGYDHVELGYARAMMKDEYIVMIAKPASIVFANRQTLLTGTAALSFLLLTAVYVLTARMLGKNVVSPIDRTNESLAKITAGNLDVRVDEHENVEFTSLSEGINGTVDALKGYIAEAETRMDRELATARAIQKGALPRVFPPFPEVETFDIFASMDAAKEVGGDFYDYFLIDDHTLGFLIADVSGKGVPGALFMMASKTELENYMSTGMDLSQAIATANKRLCANNEADMFVTVWAATLNHETGELTYVNAGHNYPLLRHGASGEWEWLRERGGFFLGTFDTAQYKQSTITLQPGDELLLYTDGVNEAFDVDGNEYGNDRLEAFLAAHSDMHSREIVRSLRADVARWAEDAEQSDDVTILALEYGVKPEVTGSVTLTATIDNLGAANSLIASELEARLCPVDVQHKVEMALEELFVNVCRYAYADQEAPGTVKVSYAYGTNPSSITIELRDKGVPFDPIKRKDPTMPTSAQEAKIGGLGIYMARKMMDDFTYMRHGDTNVVVIKKGW